MLYVEFAKAGAGILEAVIAEQADQRLQNIQCRAKEPVWLGAKLAKAGAKDRRSAHSARSTTD